MPKNPRKKQIEVSVIVTAWEEERTIAKCVESVINALRFANKEKDSEILITCPDKGTWEEAQKKCKQSDFATSRFSWVKDPGEGKPVGVNLALSKAKGQMFVLTDGDVWIEKNSIRCLVKKLNNPKIGLVGGRPVSDNKEDDMFALWGKILTETANKFRVSQVTRSLFIQMTGYLLAMKKKKGLPPRLPRNVLVDDGYLTLFYTVNWNVEYCPDSRVHIVTPRNLNDWYKQKCRSVGGYLQLEEFAKGLGKKYVQVLKGNNRSFFQDINPKVVFQPFLYLKGPRTFMWIILLYIARLYLWSRILWEQRVLKKDFAATWVRVESTK